MASSSSLSILRSASALREPIRVTGMSKGAHALFTAQWAIDSADPLVVICPDADTLESLKEEIETLSQIVLKKDLRVSVLPPWEQSPFSPISPSIRTRLSRIATLTEVFSDLPPQVILTTLEAGLIKTLSPQTLRSFSFSLKKGESVESRETLSARLADAGYLKVDPVEDPGTYSVRGDIVDVFTPGQNRAIRIELFGDEIEKIRFFDPENQRTFADSETPWVRFGPAKEILIHPGNLSQIRDLIKTRADDLGISRSVRDPLLETVFAGSTPDHSEFWAKFAYTDSAAFLSVFPIKNLLVIDELSCQQNWDQALAENKDREKTILSEGLLIPSLEEIFSIPNDPIRSIPAEKKIFLDQITLASLEQISHPDEGDPDKTPDTISAHHKTFIRANTDLHSSGKSGMQDLEPQFRLWIKQGFKILVLAPTESQIDRLEFLFRERNLITTKVSTATQAPLTSGIISLCEGTLNEGFRWPTEGLVVVTEAEVLGNKSHRKNKRATSESGSAAKDWSNLQGLTDLSVGDVVVHIDHGLGRYQGLVRLTLSGAPADFLLLEYANKDKLYLPVYRLNVIQKYMGGSDSVALDRLGSQQFNKAKEKVREAVKKIAFDLVQLYAQRKVKPGLRISPRDSTFREFEGKFPFDETPDQMKAIDATLLDMESGQAMDRLICGDVGYGKTEVAIRAAFKVLSEGFQVAVLVPTTVLAHQHEQSFKTRMKDFPVHIASVSRFKSAKEQKKILEDVEKGKVDVIIGTHRLLSKDVKFKNLALVIVDEEHRFGVEHKEKLKTLRVNTHFLTLSATPIPRTLHMALAGLRDISLINTAPINRLPIRTYVSKFDEDLVKRAIEMELSRGGQVFFVHNRVQSIYEIAQRIQELVPHAQVIVGHGQMSEGALEKVMMDFYQKKANVLVSTTIIESGLDVPTANTMIINRADRFGLAQLYQLRGRVGRSGTRAYAYLLLPAEGGVSEDAKKRLEVIQKFVELGSGFSIASHDLEIRGGGDLLGASQSGHVASVGFDLYTELLEDAIRAIQGQPMVAEDAHREPEIKMPFSAFLSEDYVPDVHQRLGLYRRLSGSATETEIDEIEVELQDRFGALPEEGKNLLWLIRIKQMLKALRVDALTVGPEKVVLTPGSQSSLDPVRAIALVASQPKKYQLTPESKFIAQVKTLSLKDLYFTIHTLLTEMQFAR